MILAALSSCAVARHTLQYLLFPLPKVLLSSSPFQGFILGSRDSDSSALGTITSPHDFHLLIFNVCHSKAKTNPHSSWKVSSHGLELVLATPEHGGFTDMDMSLGEKLCTQLRCRRHLKCSCSQTIELSAHPW